MEELLTREVNSNESIMILKVRKPDYLGESKWEFVLDRGFDAKIIDIDWLNRFQNRIEDVRPGDAIRANVRTEIRYGYEGEVVGVRHTIVKVIEVVRFNPPSQALLTQ